MYTITLYYLHSFSVNLNSSKIKYIYIYIKKLAHSFSNTPHIYSLKNTVMSVSNRSPYLFSNICVFIYIL